MRPVIRRCSEKRLAARARVVGGIDADGDHRHVVAELVERAADLVDGQRAGVLAGRVEERHDDRRAAQAREAHDAGRPRRAAAKSVGAGSPAGASRPAKPAAAHGVVAGRRTAARSPTAVSANRPVRNSARRTRGDTPSQGIGRARTAVPVALLATPRSARGGSRSARARRGRACRACAAGWRGATRRSSRRGAGPRRSRGWCAPRRSA